MLQLWPEKFQNKTNGVTPRRWIRFCNPALSKIITKWTGSDDWVLKTEKLAELKKVKLNSFVLMSRLITLSGSKVGSPNFLVDNNTLSVCSKVMRSCIISHLARTKYR